MLVLQLVLVLLVSAWKSYPFVCIPAWWQPIVAPSLLYIPAGRPQPPTVPRRGLPAPSTAFACISATFITTLDSGHSQPDLLLSKVWESWRGAHF